MKNNYVTVLMLSFFIGLTNCSPRLTEKSYNQPHLNVTPRTSLPEFDEARVRSLMSVLPQQTDRRENDILFQSTEEALEFLAGSDRLVRYAPLNQQERWRGIHHDVFQNVYGAQSIAITHISPSESPYLELALGMSADTLLAFIEDENQKLLQVLKDPSLYRGFNSKGSLETRILNLKTTLAGLGTHLEEKGIAPFLVERIQSRINSLTTRVSELPQISQSLSRGQHMESDLAHLTNLVSGSEFAGLIDETQVKILKDFKAWGLSMSSASTASEILRACARLWIQLPPARREQVFAPSYPKLYYALSSLPGSTLSELTHAECNLSLSSPISSLIQGSICPLIAAYGPTHMRDRLLQGVGAELSRQLDQTLTQLLDALAVTLPQSFYSSVATEMKNLRVNYPTEFRKFGDALIRQFLFGSATTAAGLPLQNIQILRTNDGLKQRSGDFNQTPRATSAELVGLTLLAQQAALELHQTDSFEQRRALFNEINSLSAFVGYLTVENKLALSLTRPLSQKPFEMDIFNFDKEKDYVSIPDSLQLHQGFLRDTLRDGSRTHLSFSVLGQARLLLGASQWAYFTRDWLKNQYETILGRLVFEKVPLFPKPSLYTLGLGATSVILHNLSKEGVVLLDANGRACQFNICGTDFITPVSVALLDVGTSSKKSYVSALGEAEFARGIKVFLDATEDAEKSKSLSLTTPIDGKLQTLETLREARTKLKSLFVGLIHFITSHLQDSDGCVYEGWDLDSNERSKSISLRTQALAIESLIDAFEMTGGRVYLAAAVDVFHGSIRHFFDFKQNTWREVKAAELTQYVIALARLETFMSENPSEKNAISLFKDVASQSALRFF